MQVCWCGDVVRAVTLCGLYHLSTVAGNELGAEGMAALAPALGKLVSLTWLDLRST